MNIGFLEFLFFITVEVFQLFILLAVLPYKKERSLDRLIFKYKLRIKNILYSLNLLKVAVEI